MIKIQLPNLIDIKIPRYEFASHKVSHWCPPGYIDNPDLISCDASAIS